MFLRKRFFISAFILALTAVLGVWIPVLYILARIGVWVLAAACIVDAALLMYCKVEGRRIISDNLDLGEKNIIEHELNVVRGRITSADIIDELPATFRQDKETYPFGEIGRGPFYPSTPPLGEVGRGSLFAYPTTRGSFVLGNVYAFIRVLGLLERRVRVVKKGNRVRVYPAFSKLREKDKQIRSRQIVSLGSHKRQMPSNQTEFQDIREYVVGDDIRTVNWKATARTGKVMVNNYEDERSQHIISIIDCGRIMHRTFNGLTLQDYAVNASLQLSYSALNVEGDCVGLSTYGPAGLRFLPAKSGERQLNSILQQLYALETEYGEGDMEGLCLMLDRKVQRRSLVVLYTDFATLESMERQLPFLQRISRRHTLVVVSFIDRDLENVSESDFSVQGSIASDLMLQKRLICDRLQRQGIHSVLTYPDSLTYSVVNKYLELRR